MESNRKRQGKTKQQEEASEMLACISLSLLFLAIVLSIIL